MGFAKIQMSGWGDDHQWVDADRVIRIEGKPGNWGSYMLEGESVWVKTHEGTDELVRKIEEAKSR